MMTDMLHPSYTFRHAGNSTELLTGFKSQNYRRLVKPCKSCGGRLDVDRDTTPTPETNGIGDDDVDGSGDSVTSGYSDNRGDKVINGLSDLEHSCNCDTAANVKDERKYLSGASKESSNVRKSNKCVFGEHDISEINETTGIDLQELFSKLDELNGIDELNEYGSPSGLNIADTPPGSPTSSMDSASVCSFDHFDFDTSFCSLKSTDTMEPSDLADQLSMVQQMVVEMKTGFSRAMEELSKIQYGDQTLQQQLADSKQYCNEEIVSMKNVVEEIRTEVQKISGRLQEVSDTQRSLQEKLDTYQTDKNMLLDELEQSGVINDQIRLRLTGGTLRENNNVIPPDVAPMVHPYLNSLQNHHRGPEDYNSDSSLTAAVSRSLNLTQALGEKCLNLDFSTTSSDDEDNSRHSRSGSGHRVVKRHRSFQYEETNRQSQKVPPHEQVLEQVHREEAARDIVEVEREYCSQLWSILEDYMNPLRDSELFGRRELHLLFPSYIPHLYEQHCILLRKMEERVKKWKTNGVIGDVFAKFTDSQDGDGLLLYKDFINDFPTIINSMNKWFTHSPQFREIMQSQCLANAPVLTLMLAPLQQIPKYSILLKTLLKYTPVDHPDRYYLESSLGRLKQFLNHMNDDLEHAMQTININNQPVNRSRDTGNSARSKSSASSGEVNHVSRDSGVHSNEEERAKSPLSPNSSRRYLLQMLREKREHGTQGHSTPRGRKSSGGYGSHPDLTNQVPPLQDGRMSPFLASLPQSKMFSSLSKLPLPRENSGRSRSRPHKRQEGNRPAINPHYLRPLTPQVFPSSNSAHNFDSSKRRDDFARQRPASAMEFSYASHDQQDEFLDLLAQQASLAISPPQSTSSDRSRRELQISLQKLLVETGNTDGDFDDQHQEEHRSYNRHHSNAKERMLRQDIQSEMYDNSIDAEKEDYGVYGDDDDDYENDAEFDHNVKPMQLLQDNHRPKIMVPKWRQNASPNPPSSYNSGGVTHITKQQSGSTSEENLAVSLAQSLFDGNKQATLPRDKKSRVQIKDNEVDTNNAPTNGSLKRRSVTNRPVSPVKSIPRQSPLPTTGNVQNGPRGKSLSFDSNASRPTNLNLSTPISVNKTDSVPVTQNSSTVDAVNSKSVSVPRPNSFTKLNDVIAYTADCLEKTDIKVTDDDVTEDQNETLSDESRSPTEKWSKKDILDAVNMKVSSVDSNVTPVEEDNGLNNGETRFSFATSPTKPGTGSSNNDTSSVVYYFQNRDQINKSESSENNVGQQSNIPLFMNKTSTPLKEHKQFVPPVSKSPTNETFGTLPKRESGRFVRGEENNGENKPSSNISVNKRKVSGVDSESDNKEDSEGATKERVLKAVDQLRLSFERKKQLSEERRQARNEVSSPTNVNIQKQFNDFASTAKDTETKPVVLRTFSSPTNQVVVNSPVENENTALANDLEHKQGLYKKAAHNKPGSRYSVDSAASARQIQKLERATSPTARSTSPNTLSASYEKFKSQVENSNITRPTRRGVSPQRSSVDVSLIPKRSKSPTRASLERERPKSTTDLGALQQEADGSSDQSKSPVKETKIPILKKSSGTTLSKSSEDISKIKKKTAFKDQIKNIFGRKKPQISMNRPQLTTPPYSAEEIETV
ncbi:rho guanine nucleotide exchange factor [Mactra antiquata]